VEAAARIQATAPRGTLVRRTSGRGLEVVDAGSLGEGLRTTMVFPIRHEGQLLACLYLGSRRLDVFPPIVVDALRTIASQLGPVISRFETQTSLQKSESTLRSLASSAPAGIGLVRDRIFQWVNDHMTHRTGYPARELMGQSARLLYPEHKEFERVGKDMQAQIERTGIGTVETTWKRRDGELIDVLLSAAALDQLDLSAGMVFTAWDVTKRNRAEEEQRRLERQVLQAQKLESLGMLAGGIAHDFNNILHAILGHASLAGSSLSETERVESHLDAIERAATRAGELCRQMLAYSGRGSFVIDRIHLGEVVTDLASMVDVSLSKKTELCVDVEGDTQPIQADASQMRQVVLNLITNAAEAIGDEPGLVRITVSVNRYSADRLQAEYWRAGLRPGTYVTLTVEDTGCGMDAETRERIFEPFFTTKFTGRGLGLAAIQGIVRGHGGAIRVVSEVGRGTTVTVLLPTAVGEARKRPLAEPLPPPATTHGTILLADDEPRVRELGSLMLESAGFEVIAVADGQAAVDAFREHREEISCAILDLTMPVLDGEETFRALREIDSKLPVILCSGYSTQELDQRFRTDRPAGFLEKPFTSDALLRMLATAVPAQR